MKTVSLHDLVTKLAEITLTPRQQFTYLPLPDDLITKMKVIQDRVTPAGGTKQDIDHITLVFAPKSTEDIEPTKVDKIVGALRDACADQPPLHAKVQGWAYFDGAEKDGEKVTALVALVDAPGLEDVMVHCKSALRQAGVEPASNHGFTPHFTFCYLKHGERVADLPALAGEFTVDRVCFANREIHSVPLSGNVGVWAAKAASRG